jgi:hypothetical protein
MCKSHFLLHSKETIARRKKDDGVCQEVFEVDRRLIGVNM